MTSQRPDTAEGEDRAGGRTPRRRRLLYILGGGLVVAVIALGFMAGHQELARERAREAPVAAPSRLREVSTPMGDEAAVVLDAATEQRAGIRTLVLGGATRRAGGIRLTGELIADPARVTTVRAAVPGRLTAVGAWPVLGEGIVAGRAVAQVSDARPLVVPRPGIVTRIGAQPGEIVQAGQELLQLTDFREPLARIVWRLDLPSSPPPTLTIAPLAGGGPGTLGRYVGAAAEVDTLTRAPAFLYRVGASWPGARPGLPVIATLSDPRSSVSGVFVPTEAVVQWDGLAWVYVQHSVVPRDGPSRERQYVRVRIDTSHPLDGGWLVPVAPAGVGASDTVVVRGAQQLLSEEFRARIQVGAESGTPR